MKSQVSQSHILFFSWTTEFLIIFLRFGSGGGGGCGGGGGDLNISLTTAIPPQFATPL